MTICTKYLVKESSSSRLFVSELLNLIYKWLPCLHPQLQKLRKDLQRQSTSLCACTGADHCTAGDGILTKSPHLWRTKGRETDRRSQNIPSILWRKCKKCVQIHVKKYKADMDHGMCHSFSALKFNSLDFFAATTGTCIIASNCMAPSQWQDFSQDVMAALYTTTLPSSFFLSENFNEIWRVCLGGYV